MSTDEEEIVVGAAVPAEEKAEEKAEEEADAATDLSNRYVFLCHSSMIMFYYGRNPLSNDTLA
jgi:hypothetical protein